jgi:lysophospholipase L1-like esterase
MTMHKQTRCAAAPRPRSFRPYMASVLVLLVLLGTGEGLLRAMWKHPDKRVLTADLQTLWQLPPGETLTWGETEYHINSLGYRGPEFTPVKPAGTVRIYLSGDSSVFGDGVPYDDTFGGVLLNALRPHMSTHLDLQLINGGVPGFSTEQSLARLDKTGWATAPDILIIANLWSDAAKFRFPDRTRMEGRERKPLLRAIVSCDRALSGSALYRFAKDRIQTKQRIGRVDSQGVPLDSPRRVPSTDYENNLRIMITEARERGVSPLLLLLPHATDQELIENEALQSMRSDIKALGHTEIEQEYRTLMRRVATETQTPLVDVPPLITEAREPLFLDDVHPNVAGHALIGSALATAMQNMILSSTPH